MVPWRTLMCIIASNENVWYKLYREKVYKRACADWKKSGKNKIILNLMDVFRQENAYHGEGIYTVLPPVTGQKGKYWFLIV
jgi:hypothetical protein